MKKLAIALSVLLTTVTLLAQEAELVYVDYPEVEIRRENGATVVADFGDQLRYGDSVITTRYGSAEIELTSGGTVTVSPDTVYSLAEIETSGGRQTVMSVAFGSVRFRFQQVAGTREPSIGTPTSVAGVRGTEFTANVAIDGSTVFIVDEGEVAVSGGGSTVTLVSNQGVQVNPGEAPGETFDAIERAFDFARFNQDRLEALVADPVAAVEGLAVTMNGFIDQLQIIAPRFEAAEAALSEAREQRVKLAESGTDEEQEDYYLHTYVPLRDERQVLFLNMRFYARSALSLRRYVLGRLAVALELEDIAGRAPVGYDEFRAAYADLLDRYERVVVPVLDPSDI